LTEESELGGGGGHSSPGEGRCWCYAARKRNRKEVKRIKGTGGDSVRTRNFNPVRGRRFHGGRKGRKGNTGAARLGEVSLCGPRPAFQKIPDPTPQHQYSIVYENRESCDVCDVHDAHDDDVHDVHDGPENLSLDCERL
jgi:hypothetical protein